MSTMQQVHALAAFELRGAARTRWVSVGAIAFTAAAIAVAVAGLRSLSALGLAGAGAAVDGLVHLALLLPPLIALLLGASSLARDRERGLLAMLATQPVARGWLPVAAFLGSLGAVWAVVALGLGAAMLVVAAVVTFADLATLAMVLLVSLGATASAVAIGVAISALSASLQQATAAAAALWLLLALGMDLLLAGVAPGLQLGPAGLLAAVVVNPLEAARVLALLVLDGGAALGPFGTYLTRTLGNRGALLLLTGALVAWTVVPVLVARSATRRRDI